MSRFTLRCRKTWVAIIGLLRTWWPRLLTVTVFLAGLVSVYLGYRLYQVVSQVNVLPVWPEQLAAPRAEYLEIAHRIRPELDELNATLRRGDLQHFQAESQQFKAWLDKKSATTSRAKLTILQPVNLTIDVGSLLAEVQRAYDRYLADAKTVLGRNPDSPPHDDGQWPVGLNQSTRELLALAGEADNKVFAIDTCLSVSRDWRPWSRSFLRTSVLAMISFGVWLAMVVSRRVVWSLRRKLVEAQAMLAQQEKFARFGEFTATLAHNARHPIATISACAFSLKKALDKESPKYEDVLTIERETQRLDRLVKNVIGLSRPDDMASLVAMSAGTALREVRELMVSELASHGVELRLGRVAEGQFRADPQQLQEVLVNLVRNAAESIRDKGVVQLHARREPARLRGRPTDAMVIEVEDNGAGIPADVEQHLFDPFFSTKEHGLGLGLPLAKRIVDRLGGELQFRTRVNEGTIFTIVLPICEPVTLSEE